jgi:hypothetical protein
MTLVHPSRRFFVWCKAVAPIEGLWGYCDFKGYRSAKNPEAPCPRCGEPVAVIDREEVAKEVLGYLE